MSNRRKPAGPAIARQFALQLREIPAETRRQVKAQTRAGWVHELACSWDARLGRGCHVRRANRWAQCPTHPVESVNYRGRGA